MSSILSAVSGQFSKSLMLGTFLPVVIFVILSLLFVSPLFPADWTFFKQIEALEPQWQLLAVSFGTIVLTGLLYNLNIPIIRFYEGYPWQGTRLGRKRTDHYKAEYAALMARWTGLNTLLNAPNGLNGDTERALQIRAERGRIALRLNEEFPHAESWILPTRLGNVIRSFETYSNRQYRIEAIVIWPRLIAKIDKGYAASIDDAKTSFDFTLNSSVLSGLLAVAMLVVGVIYPSPAATPSLWIPWLIEIGAFAALAYVAYLASIDRAMAWGIMVKGAFDLYRWLLLAQLGYTRRPATLAEERDLWEDISLQMLYGDLPDVRPAEYTDKPTFARGQPYVVDLAITRGFSAPDTSGTVTVTLCVKNLDEDERTVEDVIITDTLPDGYEYEWGSAQGGTAAATVTGANPYRFHIGRLVHGAEATVTYRAIQRKK